jgi:hypothetical protein
VLGAVQVASGAGGSRKIAELRRLPGLQRRVYRLGCTARSARAAAEEAKLWLLWIDCLAIDRSPLDCVDPVRVNVLR